MNEVQAFLLGIIQGLTEFLPISSTGHLYLGRHLFGLDEAGIFLDTMLHIGTLVAVLIIFKKDIYDCFRNPFARLPLLLVVGTIPAVLVGLLFGDFFDKLSITGKTIGYEFIVTGIVLFLSDKFSNGKKTLKDLTIVTAIIVGSFQALAIFPAISRSGFTIAAMLFLGFNKVDATRYSFLLSIPAILGGIVMQAIGMISDGTENIAILPLIIATLSSCFFGFVAIKWMISYLQKHSLKIFAYYTWALGILIITMQQLDIF